MRFGLLWKVISLLAAAGSWRWCIRAAAAPFSHVQEKGTQRGNQIKLRWLLWHARASSRPGHSCGCCVTCQWPILRDHDHAHKMRFFPFPARVGFAVTCGAGIKEGPSRPEGQKIESVCLCKGIKRGVAPTPRNALREEWLIGANRDKGSLSLGDGLACCDYRWVVEIAANFSLCKECDSTDFNLKITTSNTLFPRQCSSKSRSCLGWTRVGRISFFFGNRKGSIKHVPHIDNRLVWNARVSLGWGKG